MSVDNIVEVEISDPIYFFDTIDNLAKVKAVYRVHFHKASNISLESRKVIDIYEYIDHDIFARCQFYDIIFGFYYSIEDIHIKLNIYLLSKILPVLSQLKRYEMWIRKDNPHDLYVGNQKTNYRIPITINYIDIVPPLGIEDFCPKYELILDCVDVVNLFRDLKEISPIMLVSERDKKLEMKVVERYDRKRYSFNTKELFTDSNIKDIYRIPDHNIISQLIGNHECPSVYFGRKQPIIVELTLMFKCITIFFVNLVY